MFNLFIADCTTSPQMFHRSHPTILRSAEGRAPHLADTRVIADIETATCVGTRVRKKLCESAVYGRFVGRRFSLCHFIQFLFMFEGLRNRPAVQDFR
jgi:hypothetical protein